MAATKKPSKKVMPKKSASKVASKSASKGAAATEADSGRTRTARPYPASSFTDAMVLAEAIMKFAAGERVRRLTLLQRMDKSPNSGPTKQMITNSGKYSITTGSYSAEFIELTDKGLIAANTQLPEIDRRKAAFDLAIDGIAPFKLLYEHTSVRLNRVVFG